MAELFGPVARQLPDGIAKWVGLATLGLGAMAALNFNLLGGSLPFVMAIAGVVAALKLVESRRRIETLIVTGSMSGLAAASVALPVLGGIVGAFVVAIAPAALAIFAILGLETIVEGLR